MYRSWCEVELVRQQGNRAVKERLSCAYRAGYFDGFHHDGLERRENAVVLSTNPSFKLRLVVGSDPRTQRKRKGKCVQLSRSVENGE